MPHALAQKRAYMAEMRRRYRVAGLCQHCGMAEVKAYTRCTRCRRTYAKHSNRWYRQHRRNPAGWAAARERMQRWRDQHTAA